MRGGDSVNRKEYEEKLEREYARNPLCEECGSPTTEEIRSAIEGTYEYVCSDDDCEWNSFPPHQEYGKVAA